MAISTAYASLSTPLPDDTMEMSSPARGPHDHDDDIDLDFDGDYDAVFTHHDDEQMLSDTEGQRPPTATDLSMDEDDLAVHQHSSIPAVPETQMRDGEVVELEDDEELIDYDDELEYDGQGHEEVQHVPQLHVEGGLDGDTVVEDLTVHDGQVQQEGERGYEGDVTLVEDEQHGGDDGLDAALVGQEGEEAGEEQSGVVAELSGQQDEVEAQFEGDEPRDEPAAETFAATDNLSAEQEEVNHEPAINTNFDVATTAELEQPPTPTDTGLHPVILYYEDLEMPLFKSKNQPDGLLKDDNLASLSLAELLVQCRQRIATKLGRELTDDQDFVLSFERLGLVLTEHSSCSFQTSLNDVLEVFLNMCRNDGHEDIPAMFISLTTQYKFSSHFAMLKQQAQLGAGLPDADFNDGADHEEVDADGQNHDDIADVYPEGSYVEQQGQETAQSTGVDGAAEEPSSFVHGENEEEYEQDHGVAQIDATYDAEDGQADYDHAEYDQSGGNDFADHGAGDSNALEAADEAQDSTTNDEHESGLLNQDDAGLTEPTAQEPKAASLASSETVHGDDANTEHAQTDGTDLFEERGEEAEDNAAAQPFNADDAAKENAGDANATFDHHEGHVEEDFDENFGDVDGHQEWDSYDQGNGEFVPIEDDAYHADEEYNGDDQTNTFDIQQGKGDIPTEGDGESNEQLEVTHTEQSTAPDESSVNASAALAEDVEGAEDDLVFDDETTEQHEARKASMAAVTASNAAGSPGFGKRSYEEHLHDDDQLFDDEDDVYDGQPETKKARSE